MVRERGVMDAIRKAIKRYAQRLDQQAHRHTTYAFVLEAVAHRLRQILHDNPEPFWYREYAVKRNGTYVLLEHAAGIEEVATGQPAGGIGMDEPVYTRWVTAWKGTK